MCSAVNSIRLLLCSIIPKIRLRNVVLLLFFENYSTFVFSTFWLSFFNIELSFSLWNKFRIILNQCCLKADIFWNLGFVLNQWERNDIP